MIKLIVLGGKLRLDMLIIVHENSSAHVGIIS